MAGQNYDWIDSLWTSLTLEQRQYLVKYFAIQKILIPRIEEISERTARRFERVVGKMYSTIRRLETVRDY